MLPRSLKRSVEHSVKRDDVTNHKRDFNDDRGIYHCSEDQHGTHDCDLAVDQGVGPSHDQPEISNALVHARDSVTAVSKRKIYKHCDTKGKCSYWDEGLHKLDCIADRGGPALKCKAKNQPKLANSGSSKPHRSLDVIREVHSVSGRRTYQDCQLGQCSHYDELGRPLNCHLVEEGSRELDCTVQKSLPLDMENTKSHDVNSIHIARTIQESTGILDDKQQALLKALDAAFSTANRSIIIQKRNPDLLQCNRALGELICLAQFNGPPPRKYQCESPLPVTPTSFTCKPVDLFKKAKRGTASSRSKSAGRASRQVVRRQLADPAGSEAEPAFSWTPSLTGGSPDSAQPSPIRDCHMMMDGEVHCSNAPAAFEVDIPITSPAASSSSATGLLGDPLSAAGQDHHSHTAPFWKPDYPVTTTTHECYVDINGQKHCSSTSPSENAENTDNSTPTHRPHKQKPKYKASKCIGTPDDTEQCWHLTFDDQFVVCNRSTDEKQHPCEPYVGRVVQDSDYNGQEQQESTIMHGIRKRDEESAEKSHVQSLDIHHHLAKLFEIHQRDRHWHGLPKPVIRNIFTDLQIHLSPPPQPAEEGSCHPILHHRVHCTFPLPTPSNLQSTTTTTTTCAKHHDWRICYDIHDKNARFATAMIEARRHRDCYEADDGSRAECTFKVESFQPQ